MKYDDDFLQEISSQVDLVEYIGQTIDLHKRGKDYFANCPLHVDLTPSFSVNSEGNFYYCFSFGRGGSIINFLQEYEGMSFDQAIGKACKLANMDLSTMCYSHTVSFLKKMRKLKQKRESSTHPILNEREFDKYEKAPIQEWLDEGIRQEEIDLFDVRVDKRSNRIVYPVRDLQGNLINVKGRTRFKDYKQMKLRKYINYFEIGDMDYIQGLNITLPYVQGKNEIILFESIKSVMKCMVWGYKNCASVEKHSITDEQLRLLVRLKVDVVFAYDSDVSYRSKDIVRSLNILKRFTNVYVMEDRNCLLGGIDSKNSPADCGRKVFEELYEKRRRVR